MPGSGRTPPLSAFFVDVQEQQSPSCSVKHTHRVTTESDCLITSHSECACRIAFGGSHLGDSELAKSVNVLKQSVVQAKRDFKATGAGSSSAPRPIQREVFHTPARALFFFHTPVGGGLNKFQHPAGDGSSFFCVSSLALPQARLAARLVRTHARRNLVNPFMNN